MLPPLVPMRDHGGRGEKKGSPPLARPPIPQNGDDALLSCGPPTRGQSLAESVCGPRTPAHLSNLQRMMSLTSERSSTTQEEGALSHLRRLQGAQMAGFPHQAPSPSRSGTSSPAPPTWSPQRHPPPLGSPPKAASRPSSQHSAHSHASAGGPWRPPLAGEPGPSSGNADGMYRIGPDVPQGPQPQGAPEGGAMQSPDGHSTVSTTIKTPPTPPQRGAPHSGESQPGSPGPAPAGPGKTLQELSPFDAQRMLPFDDGATPRSSRSDQSSQRHGIVASTEASPHSVGVMGGSVIGSGERCAQALVFREAGPHALDMASSRASSIGSRHTVPRLDLRASLTSRSNSVLSRGSSGAGSSAREVSVSEPLHTLEGSGVSTRPAMRPRGEVQGLMSPEWATAPAARRAPLYPAPASMPEPNSREVCARAPSLDEEDGLCPRCCEASRQEGRVWSLAWLGVCIAWLCL